MCDQPKPVPAVAMERRGQGWRFELDRAFVILHSEGARRHTGFDDEALLGRRFLDLLKGQDDLEKLLGLDEYGFADEVLRMRMAKGLVLKIRFRARPVRGSLGEVTGFVAYAAAPVRKSHLPRL